jgi:exopolysaccharide biosynthesis polyprenyl glycosylphosphotransferase
MTSSKIKLSFRAKAGHFIWKTRFAFTSFSKRTLDIIVALTALLLLSPLLLLVVALIKFDSKGDVLFKQDRVGLNGLPFTMWKFRSMSLDAEAQRHDLGLQNEMSTGVTFKIKRDPRITRVGVLIRKTSIDELPQLVNVLKGEMSLVGPRPSLPSEVSEYSRADRRRLAVTPGITCIWQISGRSDIPFEQQVKLDIQYIEKQNLWFDIWVLLKTIPAVLKARGAY